MERRIYKVVYSNSKDFQDGIYHFSKPFESLKDAKVFESKIGKDKMNTRIELHNEIYERNEWQPNFDMGKDWMEVIE